MNDNPDLFTVRRRPNGYLHFKETPPPEEIPTTDHDPSCVIGFLEIIDGEWKALCCGAENFTAAELRRIAFELDCLSNQIKS